MFEARLILERPALIGIKAGCYLPGTSHHGSLIYSGHTRRVSNRKPRNRASARLDLCLL